MRDLHVMGFNRSAPRPEGRHSSREPRRMAAGDGRAPRRRRWRCVAGRRFIRIFAKVPEALTAEVLAERGHGWRQVRTLTDLEGRERRKFPARGIPGRRPGAYQRRRASNLTHTPPERRRPTRRVGGALVAGAPACHALVTRSFGARSPSQSRRPPLSAVSPRPPAAGRRCALRVDQTRR
jgi:hypothetical protein